MPRHREQPFKTMIFENYSRSEAALIAGMTEMVRIMGAVLEERNDIIQNGKAVFSKVSYDSLMKSEIPAKMIIVTQEQLRLLAA